MNLTCASADGKELLPSAFLHSFASSREKVDLSITQFLLRFNCDQLPGSIVVVNLAALSRAKNEIPLLLQLNILYCEAFTLVLPLKDLLWLLESITFVQEICPVDDSFGLAGLCSVQIHESAVIRDRKVVHKERR
jgi:hypothetical protein